jgi:hypothetical protein
VLARHQLQLPPSEASRVDLFEKADEFWAQLPAMHRQIRGTPVEPGTITAAAGGDLWDHQARAAANRLRSFAEGERMKIEELRLECLRLAQSGVSPSSANANVDLVLERARAYSDFVFGTQTSGNVLLAGARQEIDKDGFVENFFVRDLERHVKEEGFHFGNNRTETYFEPAEAFMDMQWEMVQGFLGKYPIDYTNTMELSCGHGRNSERLANLSKNIVLVDVNPENILFCQNRFLNKPWKYVINNGFDLREISTESITFVYCFEAAVHFDLEIILSYIKEFRRVMTLGAFGFVHHSNVTTDPLKDYKTHMWWRNYMSKDIFAHLCFRNGLQIVDQYVFDQGGPEADCLSLFRKNAYF